MRNIAAATIFRIIQIILLPIGAVGYVPFVVKLATFSRRSGTSATVLASLYTRYMQHRLGTRRDEICDRHISGINQLVILGAGFDTRGYRLRQTVL